MTHTLNSNTSVQSKHVYTVTNTDASGNVSDMDITFRVEIQLGASLPRGTTLTLNNKSVSPVFDSSTNVYTYIFTDNSWTFTAGSKNTHTLTLIIKTDNSSNNAISSGATINITLHVIADYIP